MSYIAFLEIKKGRGAAACNHAGGPHRIGRRTAETSPPTPDDHSSYTGHRKEERQKYKLAGDTGPIVVAAG